MNEEYIDPERASETWSGDEDAEQSYVVLALDPGGTTGWCVLGIHPDAMSGDEGIHPFGEYGNVLFWTAGEFTGKQDDQIDECVELIASWPSARLVTEGFQLRQLNAQLDPVEINAALRWAVRPRYFVKQNAALAMSTMTDDRLKALGFWLPGKEHARDATRHAITFVKRQKERSVMAARSLRRAG